MKNYGTLSMCIDYRVLNKNTKIDTYHIPYFHNIFDCLEGSAIFKKIDLAQGYHKVWIANAHEHIIAIQMHYGLFEYHILSFGLYNAPTTFQRLMHNKF